MEKKDSFCEVNVLMAEKSAISFVTTLVSVFVF
jgi:hypothetical protein